MVERKARRTDTQSIHQLLHYPRVFIVRYHYWLTPCVNCRSRSSFNRERSMFTTYTTHSGTVGNLSKEGVSFDIIGRGDVELRVVHNNVSHILTFRNTLHAPSIASNLVSVGILDLLGWKMTIGGSQILFYEPKGNKVFGGTLNNGLYAINGLGPA
ncbi:hypothetical protein L218DRAFT_1081578 [Marasmius fiardii PR-910]|nr:hypothetical protein L218DRAFT_1081578 [Marasmius fiardii PR-910]